MTFDINTLEGRTIEVHTAGNPQGAAIVFHQGAPAVGLPVSVLLDPLVELG